MKSNIKNILFYSVACIVMLVVISFAAVKRAARPVNDVEVNIETLDGNYFTDKEEVISLLNAESTDYVLGSAVSQLDLKILEERVEVHPFVKDAQVYKDIKGNLIVQVKQAKPIARVFNRAGEDRYIDADGYLIPTKASQVARVPILEFERKLGWEENITESSYGQQLLELLHFVDKDEFWRAQIAGMLIQGDGQIIMQPQVTKQEITFGMPEKLDEKFRKLKLFYKEILPNKGWNTYSSVNLKFKDQIVCE
ncbi:MAG: cell division protein FtsQ [Cyclobacteriaceae bacterium]